MGEVAIASPMIRAGLSFDAYVAASGHELLRIAYLLTGSPADAEDLCQAVLTKAYVRWDRLSDVADLDTYLRKAMLRTWLSWRRIRWRQEVPTRSELLDAVGAAAMPDVEARLTLVTALRRLPARQRASVVLRHYVDLSEPQTAEVLGCSVGAVKSQTSKGLARLRQLLVDAEEET